MAIAYGKRAAASAPRQEACKPSAAQAEAGKSSGWYTSILCISTSVRNQTLDVGKLSADVTAMEQGDSL